jgi:hypothetical protein
MVFFLSFFLPSWLPLPTPWSCSLLMCVGTLKVGFFEEKTNLKWVDGRQKKNIQSTTTIVHAFAFDSFFVQTQLSSSFPSHPPLPSSERNVE